MKSFHCLASFLTGSAALVLAVLLAAPAARANIYATDIKINGSLVNAAVGIGMPVTITYRLNEADAKAVSVTIFQGSTNVATLTGGTNRGLNSVSWTPAAVGAYSVAITAAATGFPTWTKTSLDTNAGNYAFDPQGIAVDDNTNSPYYGRVFVGCASEGTPASGPEAGVYQNDGIYKMNADGSFADEGGFGWGGYTTNDAGDITANDEMPSISTYVPHGLRMGADDKLYMLDFSALGAVISFDPLVSTNEVVIDEGRQDGVLGGPSNYSQCPDFSDLSFGIEWFDVTGGGTTNAAIWLSGDGGWGVWMFHMVNGVSDTNDTVGVQAVQTGGDLVLASGSLSVDDHLDIFIGVLPYNAGSYSTMDFTNFNGGILPPESTSTNSLGDFAYVDGTNAVAWAVASEPTNSSIRQTVIDSRSHPKYVATPFATGPGYPANHGIRVLNAADGSVVTVTNGASVQVLTNIDYANDYTCAAWDHVGNLYAASTTTNVWRVWSPPGANTNTTVAVAQIIASAVPPKITVTGIKVEPDDLGAMTVTIKFTATENPVAASFTLLQSSAVGGSYAPMGSAVITGTGGSYQAVATSAGPTSFYKIEE